MEIDLNSDLGEGFGPWRMGDDAAMLDIVTSPRQSGSRLSCQLIASAALDGIVLHVPD